MNKEKAKQIIMERRKGRVQITGTAEKPRLSVFRSLKQIFAQIINDEKGTTLASASSKEIKDEKKNKTEIAAEVGKLLAERAQAKGVVQVAFDRNRYRYHGRVQALADGAREGGLKF